MVEEARVTQLSEHSWTTEEGTSGADYTYCSRCLCYDDDPCAKEPCPGSKP